jgi:hypothetical protein
MLKLYIYGYLNRVQSSRRLEREAGRNLEVMWLTGRLVPDHKTIADFRKDNGPAIKKVCLVRRVVPQDGPAGEGQRCYRRQEVQDCQLTCPARAGRIASRRRCWRNVLMIGSAGQCVRPLERNPSSSPRYSARES